MRLGVLVRQERYSKVAMDDKDLDYLLSRGRLSGPEKERVLDNVLRATAEPIGWRRVVRAATHKPLGWLAVATMLAAGVIVPATWVLRQERPSGLRARGPDSAVALFEVGCVGGCAVGDILVIQVQGLSEPAVLAAWAEGPQGQRIWYFPADDGEAPLLEATQEPVVVQRGIRLGPEHQPGRWRVQLLATRSRLDRDQIARLASTPQHPEIIARAQRLLEVRP